MPKKNDILTVEITDITGEGMGIGKADGYVLLYPRAPWVIYAR